MQFQEQEGEKRQVNTDPREQWEPHHQVNTDPREQRQQEEPTEAYGNYYGESEIGQRGGEKLRPQRPVQQIPRRGPRRNMGWIIALIVVVVLAMGGTMGNHARQLKPSLVMQSQQPISVQSHVHVVIDKRGSGDIQLHRSNDTMVSIANTNSKNSNAAIQTNYDKQNNILTITANTTNWNFFDGNSVDITVNVPDAANVDIHNSNGDIDIDQVHADQMNITTGNGDVKLHDVSGQVSLKSGSGDIEADGVNLQGNSDWHTGNGDIDFNGAIEPNGNYRMDTGNGDITLSLPEDSSFRLETTTGNGDISNDFDSTTVGSNPNAVLTTHTGHGDIAIKKH